MDPSDAGARIGRPGASSAQLPNLRLMLGFDHGEFFVNTRSKKHGGIAGYIIFTVQKLPPLEEHPWLLLRAGCAVDFTGCCRPLWLLVLVGRLCSHCYRAFCCRCKWPWGPFICQPYFTSPGIFTRFFTVNNTTLYCQLKSTRM
jgi:hypothetical protein